MSPWARLNAHKELSYGFSISIASGHFRKKARCHLFFRMSLDRPLNNFLMSGSRLASTIAITLS